MIHRQTTRSLIKGWWTVVPIIVLVVVWASRSVDLTRLPFMPDATWSRVHHSGVLRVATDASYPPLASLTTQGEFVGMDVDVAKAIADCMGVRLEMVNVSWDGLFDALHAGKADLVISAVPYDGTLTRDLHYSPPYADLGLVLVVRDGVTPAEGFAGDTVVVELGSEAHLYARRLASKTGWPSLIVVDSTADLRDVLADGRANMAICDRVSAGQLALAGVSIALPPLVSEPVHVVTERSAGRLGTEVAECLVARKADGGLDRIIERWLGGAE